MFIIQDWAGNDCITTYHFDSFDDAEEHLVQFLDDENLDYEENRGEYSIVNVGGLV